MRRLVLVLALGALAAPGCGNDDDQPNDRPEQEPDETSKTAPAGDGGQAVIEMNDQLTFEPKRIEIAAGDQLTWRNVGTVAHTVTADKSKAADPSLVSIPAGAKQWDSGFVNEGQSYSRTFDKPGTYRYICIPHEGAGMIGTVIVR